MNKWLASLLLMCSIASSYGQEGLYYLDKEYNEDRFDELTYYYCGASGITNNAYQGRRDTTSLPFMSAFVGFQMSLGFYIKATASYAPVRFGRFDLFTGEVGYDRTFGKHLLAGASYEKYYYNGNSLNVKAGYESNFTVYCLYKNELIEPQLTLIMNQGKASDNITQFSVDHNFRLRDNTLNIYPTLSFSYGSRNFYDQYYVRRLQKKDGRFTGSSVVKGAGNSAPLNIELSARTTFRTRDWLFTLIPAYAIPLTNEVIVMPGKTITEKIRTCFFISLEACYRHERK